MSPRRCCPAFSSVRTHDEASGPLCSVDWVPDAPSPAPGTHTIGRAGGDLAVRAELVAESNSEVRSRRCTAWEARYTPAAARDGGPGDDLG
jgi:hypothetical protein